ncbi:DUF2510 domain-containing protein [Schumannella sp. 10F1B-5-1]|uniref:DUF2510 domain-containing protein n=1 Tax=Schumannella sp. 10F1B-5-1 TaxID=2590780 RepID=UPI0015E8549A|nr:DUF2510 domain-containing protein [Schumannella sp. 10F1B-5-1]
MSSTTRTAPDAGWYEDPHGHAALRWWDGAHWTAATRDIPSPSAPASSPPASGVTSPAAAESAAVATSAVAQPTIAELLREQQERDARLHELGDDLPRAPRRRPETVLGPRRSTWAAADGDGPDEGPGSSRTRAAWALAALPVLAGVLLPGAWRGLPTLGFSPVSGTIAVVVLIHVLAAVLIALDARILRSRDWEPLSPLWALATIPGAAIARWMLIRRQGGRGGAPALATVLALLLGAGIATALAVL